MQTRKTWLVKTTFYGIFKNLCMKEFQICQHAITSVADCYLPRVFVLLTLLFPLIVLIIYANLHAHLLANLLHSAALFSCTFKWRAWLYWDCIVEIDFFNPALFQEACLIVSTFVLSKCAKKWPLWLDFNSFQSLSSPFLAPTFLLRNQCCYLLYHDSFPTE